MSTPYQPGPSSLGYGRAHAHDEVGQALGFSAIFVVTGDEQARYCYISESVEDILGYEPHDLLGKSCYLIFHPEEIPVLREVHYRALQEEHCACASYLRLLHRDGYYVLCCVSYSTVYDKSVGMITRAEHGPITIQQALTAREVIEVIPTPDGKCTLRHWPGPSSSLFPAPSPPPVTHMELDQPWQKLPDPSARTAFLIDRFTDTSRVMYVTNDVIVHSQNLRNQPFYSIIRPSDRGLVRKYIETAKEWSPVQYDKRRSGGHGYARFHVLKIPDLPPAGERYPQGADDSERYMPGQEFIPVEGIFSAGSDGLVCIIDRIGPKRRD